MAETAPMTYQDLLNKRGEIDKKKGSINSHLSWLDEQYRKTHYGGMSGDQFRSIRSNAAAGLAPLEQEYGDISSQLQSAQERFSSAYKNDPNTVNNDDYLGRKADLEEQIRKLNERGSWLDAQYGANHYGGQSAGQFAAIRAQEMAGLAPLQKELDALSVSMQSAKEVQQREKQRQDALLQRQELQQRLLGRIPGLEQEMGDSLLNQQNYAYGKIQPLIEQRLNAMGILQSGALPEAQARAFGELENSRQGRLADFGIGARQMLELDYPMDYTNQDIGYQENNVNQQIELARAGLQRRFATEDMERQYQMQMQMNQQALEEARQARQEASSSSLRNALIGGAFTLGGAAIGGPAGAAGGGLLAKYLSGYATQKPGQPSNFYQ